MFPVEKLSVALMHTVVNPSTPQLGNLFKSLKKNSATLGSFSRVLFTSTDQHPLFSRHTD